jgi:hypothetical protein
MTTGRAGELLLGIGEITLNQRTRCGMLAITDEASADG